MSIQQWLEDTDKKYSLYREDRSWVFIVTGLTKYEIEEYGFSDYYDCFEYDGYQMIQTTDNCTPDKRKDAHKVCPELYELYDLLDESDIDYEIEYDAIYITYPRLEGRRESKNTIKLLDDIGVYRYVITRYIEVSTSRLIMVCNPYIHGTYSTITTEDRTIMIQQWLEETNKKYSLYMEDGSWVFIVTGLTKDEIEEHNFYDYYDCFEYDGYQMIQTTDHCTPDKRKDAHEVCPELYELYDLLDESDIDYEIEYDAIYITYPSRLESKNTIKLLDDIGVDRYVITRYVEVSTKRLMMVCNPYIHGT